MRAPSEPLQPDLRIWASQQLQIPLEATEAEARQAFVAKLNEAGFVPPPAVQEGFEYWRRHGQDQPALREQAYFDEENRLRGLIDELARGFFAMSPYQRQKRWNDLRSKCDWSPLLRARLELLEPGLTFDPEAFDDKTPQVAEVVGYLTELIVLPPRDRAQRRSAIVQECRAQRVAWEKAARTCQERYPELTRLDPFLLDELAMGKARRTPGRQRLPVPTQPAQPAPSSGDGGGAGWGWGMWPVLVVVFLIVRIFSASTSTPPPPPIQVPRFQPPQFQMPKLQQPLPDADAQNWDRIKAILDEEGMKKFNELKGAQEKVEFLRKKLRQPQEKVAPEEPGLP